ncbi:MAG: hypothetical protein ACRD1A_08585 [Terriglobales bacterium]
MTGLVIAGLGLTAAAVLGLIWLAAAAPPVARFPWYGGWALAALAACALMLALRVAWVATFFTALMWTAYIAAVDAAVYRLRGDSLLRRPGALAAMALLSVPLWLIFEAYNLRLANWRYVGVPARFWLFAVGATWAFATILPGIFETADLIHTAWTSRWRWPRWRSRGWPWMAAGAALLAVPLVAPAAWAPYLFALVWAGFIFLLDPVNRACGWPALLADLEQGAAGRIAALLLAGAACGFLWEFWNYWAAARWEYVFPILHRYRIFAMPAPGFLGFPPFALECFVLYTLAAHALLPPRLRARLLEPCASLNARRVAEIWPDARN